MSPSARRRDTVTHGLRHSLGLVRILLSRSFLSAVGALIIVATNGCVVPIGPEFQNPQEKAPPDPFKPTFTGEDPPFQTSVMLDVVKKQYFTVVVEDINPGDKISVRFVLNYPPYIDNATKNWFEMTAATNQPSAFTIGLNCNDVKDYKLSDRNLVFMASDNGFTPENLATDRDYRLSYDASGAPITVMSGWRLTGCQSQ